ncbi:MAG: hypothetical protein L0216_08575 [Planctomycetales bacterium]|nr:hypothetical protein [Planctomycetales bacterium]
MERPVVLVRVSAGGARTVVLVALLDTGSLFTALPLDVAEALGVRPSRRLRASVAVGGWRGKPPVLDGVTFRLQGPDMDAAGREAAVEVPCARALLVPPLALSGFALLGQRGFLDGVAEVRVRQREQFVEILTL